MFRRLLLSLSITSLQLSHQACQHGLLGYIQLCFYGWLNIYKSIILSVNPVWKLMCTYQCLLDPVCSLQGFFCIERCCVLFVKYTHCKWQTKTSSAQAACHPACSSSIKSDNKLLLLNDSKCQTIALTHSVRIHQTSHHLPGARLSGEKSLSS